MTQTTLVHAPQWPTLEEPCQPTNFDARHHELLTILHARQAAGADATTAHDGLACNPQRHPFLLTAGRRTAAADPNTQSRDDYDRLSDLAAAGLVRIDMPLPDVANDSYVAPSGAVCVIDGVVLRPSFETTMCDTLLARWADFTPTGH